MKVPAFVRRWSLLGVLAGAALIQAGGCAFNSDLFFGAGLSILLNNIATNFVTTSLGQWLNVSQGFGF